jgi:alpha-glucosidase
MHDPWEKNEPGLGVSRDPWRTPFQWDATPNAGFTRARPWLPLDPDYPSRNVAALNRDPTSILNLYRRLIEIRQSHPALSMGAFRLVGVQGGAIVYARELNGERILVCLNLGQHSQPIEVSDTLTGAEVLVSTHFDRAGTISDVMLRPDEGLVIRRAG